MFTKGATLKYHSRTSSNTQLIYWLCNEHVCVCVSNQKVQGLLIWVHVYVCLPGMNRDRDNPQSTQTCVWFSAYNMQIIGSQTLLCLPMVIKQTIIIFTLDRRMYFNNEVHFLQKKSKRKSAKNVCLNNNTHRDPGESQRGLFVCVGCTARGTADLRHERNKASYW